MSLLRVFVASLVLGWFGNEPSLRYLKGEDVDNWVSINEKTAEVRLNKYPDRESKFLTNGTYYVKILCITDEFASKTVTGTLAIQVQDFNDHCPTLSSSFETLCYGKSAVYVTATDGDKYPNAEPFEFKLVKEDTKEQWSTERVNDTTVLLRSQDTLWPGHYTTWLMVKDQQGKSCEIQKLQVAVCTCTEEQVCRPVKQSSSGTVLGSGGVIALLLGILLLFCIPGLLLLCECGGAETLGNFKVFPFEQQQQLITYHTEGQGEKMELPMVYHVPMHVDGSSNGNLAAGWGIHRNWKKHGSQSQEENLNNQWHVDEYGVNYFERKATERRRHSDQCTMSTLSRIALSETFLGNYYAKKSHDMMKSEASENQMLVSDYETCNSVTNSFDDICSSLKEETLDFLDDLGPQFKMLAEICCGSITQLEVKSTPKPPETFSSSSQLKVKSAVGGIHSEATSVSASSSSSTTQITTTNYGESISSGDTTSATTVDQNLLVQQPTVYLSSNPMYIMGQQKHPTLFLASDPMLGVQENNLVLLEKAGTNMAFAPQNTLPSLGLQQANPRVLVGPGIGGPVVHGFPGYPESQTVWVQRVGSTEPVHVVQSSSHSSISESHMMQAKGQSGGFMALGNESVFPSAISMSQQNGPLFGVPNGSTHKEV